MTSVLIRGRDDGGRGRKAEGHVRMQAETRIHRARNSCSHQKLKEAGRTLLSKRLRGEPGPADALSPDLGSPGGALCCGRREPARCARRCQLSSALEAVGTLCTALATFL